MASGRFVVRSGSDVRTVERLATGGLTVEGNDEPIAVEERGANEYEAVRGAQRSRLFVAGPAEAREVFHNGRVYRFEVNGEGERRRPQSASAGEHLAAPMPATVVKVLVGSGDTVTRGQVLLKIEAMKMEMPVRAPHDGTVTAVHVSEGQLVEAGVRLLDMS